MAYPKVKFSMIPLKLELDLFYFFLFKHSWGWGKNIIKRHPKLEPIMRIKKEADRKAFLKKYALDYYKKNKGQLVSQMKKDETAWRKLEKEFMHILPQIIETDWPKNRKNIRAMVSAIPICPRFLDTWKFTICGLWQEGSAIEVIMHEICHFLYFKKLEETFPNVDKKTFNRPRLEWHLSEILAPVILGGPRVQKILRREPDFYLEHQKIKIGKISAPLFFQKMYDEHLENKTSFEDFLKESYREIKVHRKLFRF